MCRRVKEKTWLKIDYVFRNQKIQSLPIKLTLLNFDLRYFNYLIVELAVGTSEISG